VRSEECCEDLTTFAQPTIGPYSGVGGRFGRATPFLDRSPQKLHTQLREAYPSTATGAANPASRSDAETWGTPTCLFLDTSPVVELSSLDQLQMCSSGHGATVCGMCARGWGRGYVCRGRGVDTIFRYIHDTVRRQIYTGGSRFADL